MSPAPAELSPHPAFPCPAVRRFVVEIDAARMPAAIVIVYRLAGDVGRLRLPPPGYARRADGLWHHSCFEAFLRAAPGVSYHEFNLAPSGDWQVYRYARPRSEQGTPELPAPRMACRRFPDGYELTATLPIAALPELARAREIDAGIAAVIEADDGSLSYWALAHAGEKPDFHEPSSFMLKIARP